MLDLATVIHLFAEVSANGALEYLHHEGEHRARKSCVPPPLGLLVADECVLRLHLDELPERFSPCSAYISMSKPTEVVTLASSSVLRMRSRPSRGTCVSCERGQSAFHGHGAQAAEMDAPACRKSSVAEGGRVNI